MAQYLAEHPDFLNRHPELFARLALPHPSGPAVSLLERQAALLRRRNGELSRRLEELLARSRANERLFEKTRRLLLTLLETPGREARAARLLDGLHREFEIPFAALVAVAPEPPFTGGEQLAEDEAQALFGPLLATDTPLCGPLRYRQAEALFGDLRARRVGSAAVVPLRAGGRTLALLALGHPDGLHYRRDVDTLFLRFLGEVSARLLAAPA